MSVDITNGKPGVTLRASSFDVPAPSRPTAGQVYPTDKADFAQPNESA